MQSHTAGGGGYDGLPGEGEEPMSMSISPMVTVDSTLEDSRGLDTSCVAGERFWVCGGLSGNLCVRERVSEWALAMLPGYERRQRD